MPSSEAKNLEAISRAIDQHNSSCPWPAVAVQMNPYEVERLGWDTIRGLPVEPDPALGTGRFRIVCARERDEFEEDEIVEAVAGDVVAVPISPAEPERGAVGTSPGLG